ncbi:MAG: HXXEE domain-containing protein [Pseudomonadota bacterium]
MAAIQTPRWRQALALTAVFLFLWLPLGQQPFLIEHWMKLGTFAAPMILCVAFAFQSGTSQSEPASRWMALLLLLLYLAHQFEEHWLDLLGRPYAFHAVVNQLLIESLALPDDSEPLSPAGIFVINTALVWLVGFLAVVYADRHRFLLYAMLNLVLVNGLVHVLAALAQGQYNPGLLTSLLLFLPASGWLLWRLKGQGAWSLRLFLGSLAWATFAHGFMVAGTLLANVYGVISETVYFVGLVLLALAPLLLFRPRTDPPA